MFKKVTVFIFSGLLLLHLCGCVALLAGAVAGTGTVAWLSGKLTQTFESSYDRTVVASEKALKSLKFKIIKETKESAVTQLKSEDNAKREIWIDIRKISASATQVDVRVGAVNPDKAAAEKILKQIRSYL